MNQRISLAKSLLHWLNVPAIETSLFLWQAHSSDHGILQTNPGDTLLNAYFLEHAFQHFTMYQYIYPSQFWSPSFFGLLTIP